MGRVLLISPPWRSPGESCLAIGTLRPLLLAAGIETDALHGMPLFPRTSTPREVLNLYGAFLFVPHLYGGDGTPVDLDALCDVMLAQHLEDKSLQGVLSATGAPTFDALGIDVSDLPAGLAADVARAGRCVDALAEAALASDRAYRVVGLSATFETQLPAALAVARAIRAAAPAIRICLGGAACQGETAEALLEAFPCIDAVCHGEGDRVIVPLVRALLDGASLDAVPGIAFRGPGRRVGRGAPAPPLGSMDGLPIPDYAPFVAQHQAGAWADEPIRLFFETSRGCWWGQKHLCSFCGLNAETLTYRRKSPERTVREIEALYERYPSASRLNAADNILDMAAFDGVLPHLVPLAARADRPLRVFFEVKSNLRRDQWDALRRSGVDFVQPGIESFSDGMLAAMKKGNTGLGQVQAIKWATEAGVDLAYLLIVRNPGDQAMWYREMSALLPFIAHLPPPQTVVPMWLERFSPYHTSPDAYGIRNVRPKRSVAELYRGPDADLDRLSYVFDYDHDSLADPDLAEAQRVFTQGVFDWMGTYVAGLAYVAEVGHRLVVVDRRSGRHDVRTLAGVAADVYRYIDRVRPRAAIHRRFQHAEPAFVDALLDTFVARRIACRDGRDRHLAVLPRLDDRIRGAPDQAVDPITRALGAHLSL